MAKPSIDGQALKRLFSAGVDSLSKNVELINRLNVFPVPDGDTGINMFHTLERAYEEIAGENSDNVSLIADRFAHGALMGARGNSGTILSQLLKGFADGLNHTRTLTPSLLRGACQAAVKQAYASVSEPTEGTILTVAREATESLPLSDSGNASLKQMLELMTTAARASLENTPNLLPLLKDSGVVDAGGMGLVCFLQGMHGDRSAMPVAGAEGAVNIHPAPAGAGSYGYDVQFLLIGEDLDIVHVRRDLEELGWSVIVVGDEQTIKVHIHVDNPANPLDYAIKSGAAIDDVVVENMELQYQRVAVGQQIKGASRDKDSSEVSVVAVVEGDGLHAVFHDLNCTAVINGGAGRNPATEDFINAINQMPSEQVIILPNDRNIVLAAQQAAEFIVDRQVQVVPTKTVMQGISAMLAFGDATDSNADLETMVAQMSTASAETTSIEITRASRETKFRELEIKQNDFIALVDDMICAASTDIEAVMLDSFAKLDVRNLELATIYYGAGVSEIDSIQLIQRLTKSIEGLEFETVYGGQSLYPFLISVE